MNISTMDMVGAISNTSFFLIVTMKSVGKFKPRRSEYPDGKYQGYVNGNAFWKKRGHINKGSLDQPLFYVNKTINYGKRNPNPIRFSNFFSKFQKNWNWPNSHPIRTKRIW